MKRLVGDVLEMGERSYQKMVRVVNKEEVKGIGEWTLLRLMKLVAQKYGKVGFGQINQTLFNLCIGLSMRMTEIMEIDENHKNRRRL